MPQQCTAAKLHNNTTRSRSVMIDKLIDTAADIIDSIWCHIKTTGSNQPKVMSTSAFVKEILKRSRATFSMLQLALFYLFRIKTSIYDYLRQDKENTYKGFVCCGRRMFLAALMIASKYLNDRNYRNMTWGKIACLPVQEINKTEHIFLHLMKFELFVSKSLYDKWVCLLHHHIQKRDILLYRHSIEYDSNASSYYYTTPTPTSPSSMSSHLSSPLSSCKSDTSSPDMVGTPNTPPALSLKRSFQQEEEPPAIKHIRLT